MATTPFSTFTFGDAMIRQSQNTARLSFEIQFRAVKRRLDTETNAKKEIYNNMDTTIEPQLGDLRRQRKAAEAQKVSMEDYLGKSRTNIKKSTDFLNKLLPKLADASISASPTAEAEFNSLRDQLNNALKTFIPNNNFENSLLDKTTKLKSSANPSGIADYASFGSSLARQQAVGVFVSTSSDGIEVNVGLSRGFGETLGLLRQKLTQDFDFAKAKQVQAVSKMKEIDKAIDKKVAVEKLDVLKDIQKMEKDQKNTLKSLSLNFEFSQANSEILADRNSFNTPERGSVVNLITGARANLNKIKKGSMMNMFI